MADQRTWRESVDELELEEEFDVLAAVGRTRKSVKKRTPVKAMDDVAVDELADEREDKRRKRRWEAPPHKRISDYDPG